MTGDHTSPYEITREREAWFKAHLRPGMPVGEVFQLNEEAVRLFPVTKEELRLKWEYLMTIPEFVL